MWFLHGKCYFHKVNFSEKYAKLFQLLLPSPFAIAVLLTFITFFIALFTTQPADVDFWVYTVDLANFWQQGLWSDGLLVFAVQMMLMLVLGHVLALTKPIEYILNKLVFYCNTTAKAAFLVTLLTILVSLFNWGLGLIFGAIFARKVGEYAAKKLLPINYPLIGAAGYSGLMVWHGGISGSSLTKIAEEGHLKSLVSGIIPESQLALLPDSISFIDTVFSPMNIIISVLLIVILPMAMFLVGKKSKATSLPQFTSEIKLTEKIKAVGAEKIDHSLFGVVFGALILLIAFYLAFNSSNTTPLSFITPNFINFSLLGLGLLLHGSFFNFLNAIEEAISGVSGILIQFPLYFGIMGIMKSSGLVNDLSAFFVSISNENTYPIFTFISAGIVNVFVPSGGGQWAVQGPIIIQAATDLGISLPKSILAMAYGDQLTNMLQPFWALPLLGITKLNAKQILPFTLFLMLMGTVIFLLGLVVF